MTENINEGSETTSLPSQPVPTEPQAQVAPEPAQAEPAPEVVSAEPVYVEPVTAPAATPRSVTISHRALWIGGGVIVGLVVLLATFGLGVAVGRHAGGFERARGGMMLQVPGQGGSGEFGWQQGGQDPHPWRNGGDGSGRGGSQDGGQSWRGGQGFRGVPRGQLPTGTPSP